MSKPTLTAMQRFDRLNREAAHVIIADPNSTTFQIALAKAFLRRDADDKSSKSTPGSAQSSFTFDHQATESRGRS